MKICGLNKTTLLDYPGKVAATVFLGGCNFRCPFCHNGGLVLRPGDEPEIEKEAVLALLRKRRGILEGVCVTGGEPTLASDLPDFLESVKTLGYHVKLDTNGTRPGVIRELLEKKLVDCIAMDIKSSPENYGKAAGIRQLDMDNILESVELIRKDAPAYEFRTTVVRGLHCKDDFRELGNWLAGVEAYFLQAYQDSGQVIQRGFSSFTKEEMEEFCRILRVTIPGVQIRGMD